MAFDKEELGGWVLILVVLVSGCSIWNSKIVRLARLTFATQPELIATNLNPFSSRRTSEKISEELGIEIPASAKLVHAAVLPVQFGPETEYQEYSDIFILPEEEALQLVRSVPFGDGNEVADQIEFDLEYGREIDYHVRWLLSNGIPVETFSKNANANRAKRSSVSIHISNKVAARDKAIRFESKRIDYSNPVVIDPKTRKLKKEFFSKPL